MDDRQVESSEVVVDLTDETKQLLEDRFEDFEAAQRIGGGPAVHELVESLVGPKSMHLAAAYLASLRGKQIRTAAESKGFKVGI